MDQAQVKSRRGGMAVIAAVVVLVAIYIGGYGALRRTHVIMHTSWGEGDGIVMCVGTTDKPHWRMLYGFYSPLRWVELNCWHAYRHWR